MLRDHAMLHTQPRGVLRAYRPHLYAPPAAAAARAQMERAWPAVLDAVVALVGTDVWLEQREHAVSAEGSAAMDGSEGIIQTVVARPDKEDFEVLMGLCVHRLAEENAAAATRGSTVPSQGQPPSWRVMANGAAAGVARGWLGRGRAKGSARLDEPPGFLARRRASILTGRCSAWRRSRTSSRRAT